MTNRPFLVPKVVVERKKLEAVDQYKFTRRSSVVERETHNLRVAGSTPDTATRFIFHEIPPTSSGRAVSQKRRFGLLQGEARETLTPVVATAGRIDPDGRRQSVSSSTCVETSSIGVNGREPIAAVLASDEGAGIRVSRSGLLMAPVRRERMAA